MISYSVNRNSLNAFRIKQSSSVSGAWIFFGIVMIFYCAYSQFPILSIGCFLVLLVIIKLLWKSYRPAVMLYWFLYQWLQLFSAIIFSDFLGLTINVWTQTKTGEYTILLGLAGLLIQAFVIALMINKKKNNLTKEVLLQEARKISITRVIYIYAVFAVLYPILFKVALNLPALRQVILLFVQLKAIFLVLLIILLLTRKEKRLLIILILAFEFISGFLTYFSSFKDVFLYGIIAYLSFIHSVKVSTLLRFTPVITGLFFLLIFWSASKEEYRQYVNQGNRVQEVQVSSGSAFKKLADLGETFNEKTFERGLSMMLFRIQYVYFFSRVVERIPSHNNYENGKVWGDAIRFAIVPRMLDANKGLHDASAKTNKYTGVNVAGIDKGVSISIGYYADSYIDFGPVGMMIPVAFIALLFGILYLMIMNFKLNIIFKYAIIIAVLSNIGFFESDSLFILGMLKNHLIFQSIFYFSLYKFLDRYIQGKPDYKAN